MDKAIQGNANGIVEQAKQTVANVAADAKAGVTTQLEQRIDHAKEVGVEKIETVSEALRGAGEKLEGTGPLPDLAEKAAEGIENLARFVENKSIGDVINGVQGFAKREPALFLGGAVLVGILAGRFLKSSSRRSVDVGDRYETYGFEGGGYASEGDFETDDYLSADDLEEDWDTGVGASDEPMAFQSETDGIGLSGSSSTESSNKGWSSSNKDWSRTTQPQASSFGGAKIEGESETKSDDFVGNKSSR